MKKKFSNINIDDIKAIESNNSFHEKRPIRIGVIILAFFVMMAILVFCFVRENLFTVNQMAFLGVFGASIVSVFTIFITLNQERRLAYNTARKSALLLSNVLYSVYSQIERIQNGSVFAIVYPQNWIHYYEQCCTYLKYDYLPYLLREFDIAEKLNQCVVNNDKAGIDQLLAYRKKSITDWTFDFTILSANLNLSMFAGGNSEEAPWNQQAQYKEFKKFIIENYGDEIKEITNDFLSQNGGHCDANDAEYFAINRLREKAELKNGPYWYLAVENRAMIDAVFSVYLSLKDEVHTAVASGSKCAANGSSAVSAATEIIS